MVIIHGYANQELTDSISKKLANSPKKIHTENIIRTSKIGIERAIDTMQPDIVIISELMPSGNYTADEIAWLREKNNVRVIPLVAGKHKGTDFMRKLFREGIYDALFIDEITAALLPTLIATQITNKRAQGAARQIYKI